MDGVLLTHGAGSDADHPLLVAIEHGLEPLPVRRMNFPYRRVGGRRPPDRAPVLIASIRDEIEAWCRSDGLDPERIVLGGRSMGGRMCSMLAAEGHPCAGLVLISYPLHPPGRPERLRRDHFGDIAAPCLFISGDRDPFATPAELKSATRRIGGRVNHRTIRGGRHELAGVEDRVAELVGTWVAGLAVR